MGLGAVWFDYSRATPTNAEFQAASTAANPVEGVCRYLSPLNSDGSDYGPTSAKVLQLPEYKWHLASGRKVKKNYEWYEGRMNEGGPAGKQDAYWAATKAYKLDTGVGVAITGLVKWIVFSNDQGNSTYANIKAYMLAAYAQMQSMPGKYLPDYYGPDNILAQLQSDPDIHWMVPGWQTCAWSGGVYGGHGALYQAICAPVTPNISGCDTNFVMKLSFYQGEDMPLTAAEIAEIAKEVWAYGVKNARSGLVIAAGARLVSTQADAETARKACGSATDFPNLIIHGDATHPNSLDAIGGKIAGQPTLAQIQAAIASVPTVPSDQRPSGRDSHSGYCSSRSPPRSYSGTLHPDDPTPTP